MNNTADWLLSHISWMWTTIIVITMGLLGLQFMHYENYSHEAQQVLARYGGLTPTASKILNRDAFNGANHLANPERPLRKDYKTKAAYQKALTKYINDGGETREFNDKGYLRNGAFYVTTVKFVKNKKGKEVLTDGALTTDFNQNGKTTHDVVQENYYYHKDPNGVWIKKGDNYFIATKDELDGKYKHADRYSYGTYKKDPSGDLVNYNGAFIKYNDPRLTAQQREEVKKSPHYRWINSKGGEGTNFVKSDKGHYIFDSRTGNYIWGKTKDFKSDGRYAGQTRYKWVGNYTLSKDGHYKNDPMTGHYVYTQYAEDENGNPIYDNRGRREIISQTPVMDTNYGGTIHYTVWYHLRFFNSSVDIPLMSKTVSQVRQGSINE